MIWHLSYRADPRARALVDGESFGGGLLHYSRQTPGADQFVPPGRCLVLLTSDARAVWVTSWPIAEYVKHEWAGCWVNSIFRNERRDAGGKPWEHSSDMIRDAIAATRWKWGDVFANRERGPRGGELGLVTFIDPAKVKRKRDLGRSYRRAGFEEVGTTKEKGLLAFLLRPKNMPPACAPVGAQLTIG